MESGSGTAVRLHRGRGARSTAFTVDAGSLPRSASKRDPSGRLDRRMPGHRKNGRTSRPAERRHGISSGALAWDLEDPGRHVFQRDHPGHHRTKDRRTTPCGAVHRDSNLSRVLDAGRGDAQDPAGHLREPRLGRRRHLDRGRACGRPAVRRTVALAGYRDPGIPVTDQGEHVWPGPRLARPRLGYR